MKTSTGAYIPPSDPDLFKLGKNELRTIAEGRGSKRQAAAVAELERRRHNRKKAGV